MLNKGYMKTTLKTGRVLAFRKIHYERNDRIVVEYVDADPPLVDGKKPVVLDPKEFTEIELVGNDYIALIAREPFCYRPWRLKSIVGNKMIFES